MTPSLKDTESSFTRLCEHVYNDRLKEALDCLSRMMEGMHIADFTLQYEDMNQTYRMLLEYTFRGVPDPQRNAIFAKLKVSVLELADRVKQQALGQTGMHIYQLKSRIETEKEIAKEEATRKIDNYSFELEFTRLLNDTDLSAGTRETSQPAISPKLFQLMWLTDKYTETDLHLIRAIRESTSLPWFEKCLAVSAITLSLINCFDKEKFTVLCEFYDDRQPQVWQRAFTGLVIALFIYGRRMELYPVLQSRLKPYSGDTVFASDINDFLIQLLKSLETEAVTRQFREEILPDVQKFESRIREKLDLDNLINNDMIEDKNPDWQEIFGDSPDLLNKIEKMSEMQMEGLDLFMGTFAQLKNFDFFREISNWFRPFYKQNDAAAEAIALDSDTKSAFLSGLEDAFYMCNSDKYSFCFNIRHLPEEQSRNVVGLFNMEAQNVREMVSEENLLNKAGSEMHVFTQYIQDLYRFFKLHPFRNDFRDIFSMSWDIAGNPLIAGLEDNKTILRSSAEFLFSKSHYRMAASLFKALADMPGSEQAVHEKLAYCYQMSGNYADALVYFKRAELFDSNRLWSLKKIIFCYRKLGDTEAALKWCLEAESLAKDDPYIQTMLGNCYLDLTEYEKALSHYFRVELLSPENTKVLRPIAWCCFVLGKPDISKSYYQRILDGDSTPDDLINAAHVELSLGNKPKATEYYLAALSSGKVSFQQFIETLDADSNHLISCGVEPSEIRLMADYLRYRLI
jgi:tetratricopeptide (TPR) repeat protein